MEFETYADVIDAYERDNMGYDTLTDYINKQNIKIKEIDMDPIGDFEKIFKGAYGGGVGHLMEPTQTYHQYHDFTAPMTVGAMVDNMYNRGGRVNLYNGGNPHAGGYKSSSSKSVGGKGRGRQDPMGGYAPDHKYSKTASEMRQLGPQWTGGSGDGGDNNPPQLTLVDKNPNVVKDTVTNAAINFGAKELGLSHLVHPAFLLKGAYDFFKKPEIKEEDVTLETSEVTDNLPDNTLFTEVTKRDIAGKKMGMLKGQDRQSAIDMGIVNPNITEFEFEELQKGNIKKPGKYTAADGGRVGMFMGGDPLTGQALSIYESMNSYGFSDAEIASALQQQGLYTPPGSGTPTPDPDPTPGQGEGQGGGSDGDPRRQGTIPGLGFEGTPTRVNPKYYYESPSTIPQHGLEADEWGIYTNPKPGWQERVFGKYTGSNYPYYRQQGAIGRYMDKGLSPLSWFAKIGQGVGDVLGGFFGKQNQPKLGTLTGDARWAVEGPLSHGNLGNRDAFGIYTGGKTLFGDTESYEERLQNRLAELNNFLATKGRLTDWQQRQKKHIEEVFKIKNAERALAKKPIFDIETIEGDKFKGTKQQQQTISQRGREGGSGGKMVDRRTGAMKGYEKGAGGGKDAPSQHFYIKDGGIAQYAPKKKGIASMFTRRR
jgi:hypothetical protein